MRRGSGVLGLRTLAIAAVAAAAAGAAFATTGQEELFERTWAGHLPQYCLYTQLLPDAQAGLYHTPTGKKYLKQYGPAFFHTHHYCWGLDKTYRASMEEDDFERRALYRSSVEEFDYVLMRSTQDFVLRVEILVNKGIAQEALGKYVEAVESYTEALRLRRDYPPAYVGLSSCFEALGDRQRALTIIESGLALAPDSEALLERRLALTSRADSD